MDWKKITSLSRVWTGDQCALAVTTLRVRRDYGSLNRVVRIMWLADLFSVAMLSLSVIVRTKRTRRSLVSVTWKVRWTIQARQVRNPRATGALRIRNNQELKAGLLNVDVSAANGHFQTPEAAIPENVSIYASCVSAGTSHAPHSSTALFRIRQWKMYLRCLYRPRNQHSVTLRLSFVFFYPVEGPLFVL